MLILLTLASIWFAYLATLPNCEAFARLEFSAIPGQGALPDFTSPEIIDAVISRPEVAQLETIKGHANPSEWLRQHLTVHPVGESTLFEVSILGTTRSREDFAIILDGLFTTLTDVSNNNRNLKRPELYSAPKTRMLR